MPKIQMMGKAATNLGQLKAPATIAERPAVEEQDNGVGNGSTVSLSNGTRMIQNHQSFKLERDQSPNSIVGNFCIKTNDEGGLAQDSIYEEKHEGEEEDEVRGKENDNAEDDERVNETKKPVNLATVSAIHRQN